ncbi:hypothetical protein ABRP29_20135 [Pseudomonas sp. WHRI 8822A]|uniref:hypothetical protein n=1 Tax=Pseudomonas sp. WHRI 8822A TaxID=3162568 RepID=UPI0032EC251C
MKVDKDDVPDYLKPRKKQGPWRTLAILGVGSAIFCGLVAVFEKPIMIDVVQLKQSIRFGGEPIFSQQAAQPQQPSAEALQGKDQDWIRSSQAQQSIQANRELEEWSRQRAQETQERQTSFNDSNYKPKNAVNTYAAPRYQHLAAATPEPNKKPKPISRRERESHAVMGWDNKVYYAAWEVIDNVIDGGSVCATYNKGSFEYRECRKGAKQFFHEQCRPSGNVKSDRLRQRYCSAASGFNPAG